MININKIFEGAANLLNFGSNDKQAQANAKVQTFVPQSAVDGWLASLYRLTETKQTASFAAHFQQQTQEEPPLTAEEDFYYRKLIAAEKDGKTKEAKPRLPESVLSQADPKAAAEKFLTRTVERYYYFYKDITDQAGTPTKENPNTPRKSAAEINTLKTERDALTKAWTDDFQKTYDKAFKEVEKGAKKNPMSADQMQAKATALAVERWNSKLLFGSEKADENAKADKNLERFVKGENEAQAISLNDVRQGQIGNCYLLAGIGAIAHRHPELIPQILSDKNANGKYTVTLYKQNPIDASFEKTQETVDGKLMKGDKHAQYGDTAKVDGKEQKEAWTVLIEKAYIQGNVGSYEDANKGGSVREVMTALTGRQAVTKISGDVPAAEFAQLLKSNRAIVLSTPDKVSEVADSKMRSKFQEYGLVENHAYVLQEVKTNAKGKEVAVLYNPWGTKHAEVPINEVQALFKYVTAEGDNAK